MKHRPMGGRAAVMILAGLCAGAAAQANVIHDEGSNGDISSNRLVPTSHVLSLGSNTVSASNGGGDIDYLTLTVPGGMQLANIMLMGWAGPDEIGFIAVQSGAQFTESASNPNVTNMLGWTHYGPALQGMGADILPDIGAGSGAIGFTPPLNAGTYTFWINQTGSVVSYELDFVVIPAPGAAGLAGLAGLVVLRRRRAA